MVFSKNDLERLENQASAFVSECNPRYRVIDVFYRNKPPEYFVDIRQHHAGIMQPLLKDNNGDPKCPANGKLKGLFFMGKNNKKTPDGLPDKSPFGERRVLVPAHKIFNGDVRLYFSDFWCHKVEHYVSLIITKPNSKADQFCQKHLLELDISSNKYLRYNWNGRVNMLHGYTFWTEVYYTECIDLNAGGITFSTTGIIGKGRTTPGGIRKNPTCTICNITTRPHAESNKQMKQHGSIDRPQHTSKADGANSKTTQPTSNAYSSNSMRTQSTSNAYNTNSMRTQPTSKAHSANSMRTQPTSNAYSSNSMRTQPTSNAHSSNSMRTQPTSNAYNTNSMRTQPTSNAYSSNSMRTQPTSNAYITNSMRTQPTSNAYSSNSMRTQPTSNAYNTNSMKTQPTSNAYSSNSMRTQPTSNAYSSNSMRTQPTSNVHTSFPIDNNRTYNEQEENNQAGCGSFFRALASCFCCFRVSEQ